MRTTPTERIEDLTQRGDWGETTLDDLFQAARSREIRTILPEAFMTDDGFGVRLPHDPEYKIEAYKQPPRPEETSRIVMRGDRWRTERGG